jgi:ParB family transcriptional regulator, chromosome partitioning protein
MRKLGRGLSELGLTELLGSGEVSAPPGNAEYHPYDKIHHLSVDALVPGQYQPRQHIDQTALAELADSIRAQGILQPLIVRAQSSGRYEIIAGERRWRAAQMAGLDKVPVIIREISDQTAIAFGLIENIQRRDLNALEEAQALQRLLHEFNLTHDAVAHAVGKSRATISNLLRLLQLNADVKSLLAEGRLEMGHARALLALEGSVQSECAQRVAAQHLSVRQTEALVQQQQNPAAQIPEKSATDFYAIETQRNLAEKLRAKVAIRHNARGKGKIVIHYHNLDELSGILNHIQ